MRRMYSQQEIEAMLFRLNYVTSNHREYIKRMIINGNYGIDTEALINIVGDPEEYNIDYLNSLDSAVTEEFIEIMEQIGNV